MISSVTFFALVLRASAALLPVDSPEIVPRGTVTTSAPACNASAEVLINQNFYYDSQATDYDQMYQTYAPWNVTPTGGSPGCQYIQGYRTCIDDTASGDADSNCLYVKLRSVLLYCAN